MKTITFDYHALFNQVTAAAQDAIILLNHAGDMLHINNAFEDLYGWTLQELEKMSDLPFLPDNQTFFKDILANETDNEDALKNIETTHITKGGNRIQLSLTCTPIRYDEELPLGLLVVMRNITEQKAIHNVIENTSEPVFIHDHGTIIYMNKACAELLKAQNQDDLLGTNIFDYIHEDFVDLMNERVKRCYVGEEVDAVDIKIVIENEVIWVTLSPNPVLYKERQCTQVSLRDVTAAYNRQQRMEEWAFHDALTGLPNRRYFIHFAEQKLAERNKAILHEGASKSQFALMSLDCDDFKQINDRLGHDTGDHVLKRIGYIIHQNIRKTDFVARIGGDEFLVLFEFEEAEQEIHRIVDHLQEKLNHTWVFNNQPIKISMSYGLVFQTKEDSLNELIKRADQVLYNAKREQLIHHFRSEQLRFGNLSLDIFNQKLYVNNIEIELSTKEFLLLNYLIQRHDKPIALDELYCAIWGTEVAGDTRTVLVHISHLRKKIEKNPSYPKWIKTIRGKGYLFDSHKEL